MRQNEGTNCTKLARVTVSVGERVGLIFKQSTQFARYKCTHEEKTFKMDVQKAIMHFLIFRILQRYESTCEIAHHIAAVAVDNAL